MREGIEGVSFGSGKLWRASLILQIIAAAALIKIHPLGTMNIYEIQHMETQLKVVDTTPIPKKVNKMRI